ncbi:hypothetical protein Tco_1160081, partial [Tanacetum coccineum]
RKRASRKDREDSLKRQKLEDDAQKEDLQEYLTIVPEEGMNVEALQTKYPLIDWEIYTEESRVYWKIIIVGDRIEIFSSTEPIDDKDKALWVELKRIFEPDTGLDMFMLVENGYPLTGGLAMLMLVNKLQVDQHSEMADELLQKIFILANRPNE